MKNKITYMEEHIGKMQFGTDFPRAFNSVITIESKHKNAVLFTRGEYAIRESRHSKSGTAIGQTVARHQSPYDVNFSGFALSSEMLPHEKVNTISGSLL